MDEKEKFTTKVRFESVRESDGKVTAYGEIGLCDMQLSDVKDVEGVCLSGIPNMFIAMLNKG